MLENNIVNVELKLLPSNSSYCDSFEFGLVVKFKAQMRNYTLVFFFRLHISSHTPSLIVLINIMTQLPKRKRDAEK
jgi:hypothetical protein